MRIWDDLRFVIGLFFLLVAVTLIIFGGGPSPDSTAGGVENLNGFASGLIACFAILMLVLTFLFPMKQRG
jgi:hypothetical protein